MSHCCFLSYCPLLSDRRLEPPSLPVACYFQWILLVTWGLESWPVNKSGQEVEGSAHSRSCQRLSLQLSETKRESLPESCPLSPSPSSNDGSCVRWTPSVVPRELSPQGLGNQTYSGEQRKIRPSAQFPGTQGPKVIMMVGGPQENRMVWGQKKVTSF